MKLNFHKYQGAGNDFVIIDARGTQPLFSREVVSKLCHRRFGIGADGFMTLENDATEQFYMRYWNADGGESTMCGNGGRCIALFAHHLGIQGKTLSFNSSDGVHKAEILQANDHHGEIRLGMIDVPKVELYDNFSFLFTGSPHYVEFVDNVNEVDVDNRGRQIRNRELFASGGGTNVNFVEVISEGHIRIRTFERGVEAETLACGTGATAAAIATTTLLQMEITDFRVDVQGGSLRVTFDKTPTGGYHNVQLSGPATRVFEGTIEIF